MIKFILKKLGITKEQITKEIVKELCTKEFVEEVRKDSSYWITDKIKELYGINKSVYSLDKGETTFYQNRVCSMLLDEVRKDIMSKGIDILADKLAHDIYLMDKGEISEEINKMFLQKIKNNILKES